MGVARGCGLRSRPGGRAGAGPETVSSGEAAGDVGNGVVARRAREVGWRWALGLFLGMASWGCAGGVRHAPGGVPQAGPVEASAAAIRPMDASVGRVVRVQGGLRFVVVDFGLSEPPRAGMRLWVHRGGERVGVLKAGHFRRETTMVADVVSGEVLEGDEVRPEIAD